MKEIPSNREVEHQTSFETTSFGIAKEDASHVLGILRDRLYSNKPLAPIREYSCNAADAHVAAGVPSEPIDIHFPHEDEPWFSVRDRGGGLTEDEVRNLYVMYGRSTKRNTNEQVGMLGLGCKSAFAYTDSFSIISIKDGIESIYSAVIDPSGVGKITKLAEKPTNEHSGIEVKIPVRSGDFKTFFEEGMFFRFWPIQPTFNIDPPYTKNPPEIIFEGDANSPIEWKIMKTGDTRTFIMMGGVTYPVDRTAIKGIPSGQTSIYWKKYDRSGYSMVITVPIGAVEMAASRESLEYKDTTCAYLCDINDKVRLDMQNKVDTIMADAKDFYEAHRLRQGLKSLGGSRFAQKKGATFTWKGIEVKDEICRINTGTNFGSNKMQWCGLETPGARKLRALSAHESKKILFVKKDKPGWVKRSKLFLHAHPEYDRAVSFIWGEYTPSGMTAPISAEQHYTSTFNLDSLPWVNVSELPEVPRKKPGVRRVTTEDGSAVYVPDQALLEKHKSSLFTYKWTGEVRVKSTWWDYADTLIAGPKLYVALDRFMPSDGTQTMPVERIAILTQRLRRMGCVETNPTVYGIKQKKVEAVIAEGEWVEFNQWALDQARGLINTTDMRQRLLLYSQYKDVNQEEKSFLNLFLPLLDEDNILRDTLAPLIQGTLALEDLIVQGAWDFIQNEEIYEELKQTLWKAKRQKVGKILARACPLLPDLVENTGWDFNRYSWPGQIDSKTKLGEKDHTLARILNLLSRHDPAILQGAT